MSFKSAVNKTKKVSKPSKKSNVKEVNIPEKISKEIEKYKKLVAEKKKLEANMNKTFAVISEFASEIQDKDGFAGNYSKSYQLGDLKYVTKNQFSINPEDEGTIKDLLGKNFKKLIEEEFSITLKEEVISNEELQEEFMEIIGEENFGRFFDANSKLKAKDDFDKNIYEVVKTKDKLKEVRVFIKQYKAALK